MWIIRTLVGKIISGVVLALLVFGVFIGVLGGHDSVTYREDVAIVLGAGFDCTGNANNWPEPREALQGRLHQAAYWWHNHENNDVARIIVTGGNPRDRRCMTEAYAMQHYLSRQGVPGRAIILEENALSTVENMEFSHQLMQQHGFRTAVIITSRSHMFRARQAATRAGILNATTLHSSERMSQWPLIYAREIPALLWFWFTPSRTTTESIV
ncbi:YdcF family protein [Candidatus Saccharibacteria bacterium]|nr:YdcF family protein [Candidatus Saccharibacteria bacterium]